MPGNAHTSVRSRQVAAQLRELREQAELSCSEVARTLGISVSKVSRMETAHSGMQADDVAAMLGLYRVPADRRQQILDALSHADERGWWQRQPGLPRLWRHLIDCEAKASRIQNFECAVVPGLLQTAEYCRAVIHGVNPSLPEAQVDHLVATRMARQAVLTRSKAPEFLAVLDESVLHRVIGDEGVRHRQLLHIAALAQRPNVAVRVVPRSSGAYCGLRGPFVILEFSHEPALVHVEHQTTARFLDEDADLRGYRQVLGEIENVALSPDESIELVGAITAQG